jgi:cytoskeleton-associated protein 5
MQMKKNRSRSLLDDYWCAKIEFCVTSADSMHVQAKKAPTAAASSGGAEAAASAGPATAPPVKKLPPAAVAAVSKPAKGGAAPPPGALDSFKYKHTPEDAEALAAEVIPEGYATGLSDSNWKTRLASLEEMSGWVESSVDNLDSEVVVRFLAKKGWNEKNFQV